MHACACMCVHVHACVHAGHLCHARCWQQQHMHVDLHNRASEHAAVYLYAVWDECWVLCFLQDIWATPGAGSSTTDVWISNRAPKHSTLYLWAIWIIFFHLILAGHLGDAWCWQ